LPKAWTSATSNSSFAAASTELTYRFFPGFAQSMTQTGGCGSQVIGLIFADKIASAQPCRKKALMIVQSMAKMSKRK
jgi:hypothetical protein